MSTDTDYEGISADSVNVTVDDNDSPGVTVAADLADGG